MKRTETHAKPRSRKAQRRHLRGFAPLREKITGIPEETLGIMDRVVSLVDHKNSPIVKVGFGVLIYLNDTCMSSNKGFG